MGQHVYIDYLSHVIIGFSFTYEISLAIMQLITNQATIKKKRVMLAKLMN